MTTEIKSKSIWTSELKDPDNWKNVANIDKIKGVSFLRKRPNWESGWRFS